MRGERTVEKDDKGLKMLIIVIIFVVHVSFYINRLSSIGLHSTTFMPHTSPTHPPFLSCQP